MIMCLARRPYGYRRKINLLLLLLLLLRIYSLLYSPPPRARPLIQSVIMGTFKLARIESRQSYCFRLNHLCRRRRRLCSANNKLSLVHKQKDARMEEDNNACAYKAAYNNAEGKE